SATIGCSGNRRRSARTAWSPSARMRGVPASSQSTPARTAISAVLRASSSDSRSREICTLGPPSSGFFNAFTALGSFPGKMLRQLPPAKFDAQPEVFHPLLDRRCIAVLDAHPPGKARSGQAGKDAVEVVEALADDAVAEKRRIAVQRIGVKLDEVFDASP